MNHADPAHFATLPLLTTALGVFLFIFLGAAFTGYIVSRRSEGDGSLHDWGLAGRKFGPVLSWFLIGGDLYTAYTFIAVPALMFGAGAIGFFAVPYTVLIYPLAFWIMPKLWTIARENGFVTAADIVAARHRYRPLDLAVALTGIAASLPYIALQLFGIQIVIAALGFPTHGLLGALPLLIAFVVLVAYTNFGGLRAPAAVAVIKDCLIYAVILVALATLPHALGGWVSIFGAIPPEKLTLTLPTATSLGGQSAYITLAIGSAVALLLYPHTITAMFSAKSPDAIRRNAVFLPMYSLLLGGIALLGFMAFAAHLDQVEQFAPYFAEFKSNFAVPALFLAAYPQWFIGVAFAAIAVGALVPASIMSIASANLWTKNVAGPLSDPRAQTRRAKLAAIVIKVGALGFAVFLPHDDAIVFQLLGGVWILQTFPTVFLSVFWRGLDSRALLAGLVCGIIGGTYAVVIDGLKPIVPLNIFGSIVPVYGALVGLFENLVIAFLGSLMLKLAGKFRAAYALMPEIAAYETTEARLS